MLHSEAPTIVGLRPQESAVNAPIAAPSGAPNDMMKVKLNDCAMLNPSFTKNDGSQVMKPNSSVLTTIIMTAPTNSRGSISVENSATCGAAGAGAPTGGSGFSRATSASIAVTTFSACSVRPADSSQRGDSGRFLRRYQTTSAPTPAMANIQCQPMVGMTKVPTSEAIGSAVTTKTTIPPSHLPRTAGGTNSVSVAYPTTISAPRPTPVTKRIAISACIVGAKAAAIDARPNSARLN